MAFWNTIPQLWLPPMAVVYRVEHKILKMPAKGGEFLPNIEPRDINPRNIFLSGETHHREWLLVHIVEVPRVVSVLQSLLVDYFLSFPPKT